MKAFALFILSLFAVPAFAQTSCIAVGTVVTCTGEAGVTTQIPSYSSPSYSQGYLAGPNGVDTYQVFKTPPARFDPTPLPSLPELPSVPNYNPTPLPDPFFLPSVSDPVFLYGGY
jgi:hypothetical protein